MALIPVYSENIKMEDMTLDFSLDASGSDDPSDTFQYDGKITSIGPYRDGYAFGITSIEIDTSLNMQPQIEITFKDLYGNMVFRDGGGKNYSRLFELPPPKFTLTFKGYVGQPIKYTLQLRSTSVNYITSDGSYEIKSKFVPNIYGFFGDIPYKFLYSVDKLKTLRKEPLDSSSILNIVKNGDIVNEKVEAASDQYAELKNKLTIIQGALAGDGTDFYNAISAGTFSNNKTVLELSNIQPSIENFTGLEFKFNNKRTGYIPAGPGAESFYGIAAARSINSPTPIDLALGTWSTTSASLSGRTSDLNKIITDNLTAIEKATQRTAGTQLSQEVLDTQTISSVMSSLAGEAAYVLGYILEGGINGDEESKDRNKENNLIGKYYPLIYQENTNDGTNGETIYEQIPYPNAVREMQYVQDFMKAQYEGTQQVQRYKEEQEAKQNGTDGAMQQGAELKKRLTNAEAFKANPYANQSAANTICINMLQRAGIINSRLSGPVAGDSDYSNSKLSSLQESEYLNIKIGTDVLTGTQREEMRNFANRVTTLFNADGTLQGKFTNFVDSGNTATYQQYFQDFFNGMKVVGLDNKMFLGGDITQLICNYFINNEIIYQNDKELSSVFGTNDVYIYVPSTKATLTSTANSTGTTDISETLNGESTDPTAAYVNEFYKFQKAESFSYASDGTLMLDYEKLAGNNFYSIKDMTVKVGKTAPTGGKAYSEGDFVAPYLELSKGPSTPIKNYVLSLKGNTSIDTIKTLYYWCNKLKADLPATDREADIRKNKQETEAASGSNGDGASMDNQTVEPYSFDSNVFNAIYHQFHHIANSWANILESSLNGGDAKGLSKTKELAKTMEGSYRNDKKSASLPYNMSFQLAVQTSNLTNETLKKAIINTSSMLETDTESSTFSMMSNIAQQNNFLMQSIPGGLRDNSDEFDVETLFKPVPSYDKRTAPGNASLVFIWQPTPESRSLNNKNEFLYGDTQSFVTNLQTLPGKTAWFQFGSPDNIIVKSIKATTDENKVTGESIAAVDDIINTTNQNKKRAFDCSMLSVMQGRSYKVGMEILGNASFLPTQKFAITNLPIFTGLYWTSNVKHSITPNSMTTSIEAMKLKYDGVKFGAVLPVTSATYKGGDTGGGGNTGGGGTGGGGGTENIISDGLNWEYLQKIKDEKMRNATEINAFIKKVTLGAFSDYPTWFNTKVKGNTFCGASIDSASWTKVWDSLIPLVWSDYGTGGINFLEFLCMNMIMYNETGGKYRPISENMNSVDNAARPGVAYAFDKIPNLKQSYNKDPNKTAGTLFRDPKFKSRFANLPFGNDKNVAGSSDARWDGGAFPLDLFPGTAKQAANPNSATFINQADFFKFRGRGLIQTTWRGSYKKLVNYILTYTGSDQKLIEWKGKFKSAPYNGDAETILTLSSNQDWDDIFQNSTDLPAKAIQIHADGANKYQYFKDLTQSKQTLEKKVAYVAYRVSGSKGEYTEKFSKRVYIQLDILSPSTVNKTNNNYTPPSPPANSSPKQVTAIKSTLTKLYAPTKGAGVGGMCGIYTVTAAQNYSTLLKDPNAKVKEGAFIGRNAKDSWNRDQLAKLGYKVGLAGTKLSKKDVISKINSEKWGIGDVAIYWADDRPSGWDAGKGKGSQVIYGHIQIYQGQQYNKGIWSTSVPTNYGASFVYGTRPNEEWTLYICRSPAAPTA